MSRRILSKTARRNVNLNGYRETTVLPPQKTFAEFFAGIGLMRIGLEREGWRIAFANDIDEDKFDMYRAHFGDAESHFRLGDIHALAGEDVPEVALATASFPCNDLSLAGARGGLGGRQSSAYWGFIRLLERMGERRPPIVLLENVAGFLTSGGGADFKQALIALNDLGYAVDAFVIDAEHFVPQSRVRLFVVGHRAASRSGEEDHPVYCESDVRPGALARFIFENPDIRWKLRELPRLPKRQTTFADLLEDLPDSDEQWWSEERTTYLVGQMSDRHHAELERMKNGKGWSHGTVFRRVRNGRSMAELRTDGVAGCLRTPRGGSGRQILVKAGFGAVRARLLTPVECARLMGADDFKIETTLNKALFGFGDAVCVPAISWIARHYLNPLCGELCLPTRAESVSSALMASG